MVLSFTSIINLSDCGRRACRLLQVSDGPLPFIDSLMHISHKKKANEFVKIVSYNLIGFMQLLGTLFSL